MAGSGQQNTSVLVTGQFGTAITGIEILSTSTPFPAIPYSQFTGVSVKDPLFGAVGDGVTDDTAAVQAAIDAVLAMPSGNAFGGTLFFPSGNYLCGPLRFYRLDLQQVCFRVIGASCHSTQLTYKNKGTGNFLSFGFTFQFEFRNFEINNPGSSGTTTAIQFGFTGGSGSTMGGGIVELVTINNFNVGIDTGGADANQSTSSEVNYRNVEVTNCTTGIYFHDANCLDHNLNDFLAQLCHKAFRCTTGGNLNVWGGSASGNATDFSFEGCAGTYSIRNFRTETVGTSFCTVSNFGGMAEIEIAGCMALGDANPANMITLDGFVRATIHDCFIDAPIRAGEGGANIDIRINSCAISDTVPFHVFDLGGGVFHYSVVGSYQAFGGTSNAFVARFLDQWGRVDTGSGTLIPTLFLYNTATGVVVTTVGGLTAATTATGGRATVTDSTVAASGNFGAIVSGGSNNTVPVWSDGTNWRIG